jgi:hypothetical protein
VKTVLQTGSQRSRRVAVGTTCSQSDSCAAIMPVIQPACHTCSQRAIHANSVLGVRRFCRCAVCVEEGHQLGRDAAGVRAVQPACQMCSNRARCTPSEPWRAAAFQTCRLRNTDVLQLGIRATA